MHLDRNQVSEVRLHHFVVEASSLGLKPGEWPRTVQTNIGNGQPFVWTCCGMSEDEVTHWHYAQICGCTTLDILND